MKLLLLWTLLFCLYPSLCERSTQIAYNFGIHHYRNEPVDINKQVSIAIPFHSKITTVIEYSYSVSNALHQVVYQKPLSSFAIYANTINFLTYTAPSGKTSVGRNFIDFNFKDVGDKFFRNHFIYFYGFLPGEVINLHNKTEAKNKFGSEKTYIYDGYQINNERTLTSTLFTENLTGSVYLDHDFHLDLHQIYFYLDTLYGKDAYDNAFLYCYDLDLFPFLTKVGNTRVINLKLDQTEERFSFTKNLTLFVDPNTKYISNVGRTGFVLSEKIYFPAHRYGTINGTRFRLTIYGFGYHKFTIHYEFTLEIGRPYIGSGGYHEAMINRY